LYQKYQNQKVVIQRKKRCWREKKKGQTISLASRVTASFLLPALLFPRFHLRTKTSKSPCNKKKTGKGVWQLDEAVTHK